MLGLCATPPQHPNSQQQQQLRGMTTAEPNAMRHLLRLASPSPAAPGPARPGPEAWPLLPAVADPSDPQPPAGKSGRWHRQVVRFPLDVAVQLEGGELALEGRAGR
jgi:hypothetical protein